MDKIFYIRKGKIKKLMNQVDLPTKEKIFKRNEKAFISLIRDIFSTKPN